MPTVNDALEFRLKRVPDILFTTSEPKVIARLQRQFAKGEPLSVKLPGWHGKAYVLKLVPRPFTAEACDVTLRPTGSPCSRPDALRFSADQVTLGPERAYSSTKAHKMTVTGLPMIRSALDKLREHTNAAVQLAVQRETENMLGVDYGKSPSFTVVDDPLGPDPLGTPASRERIMHWYNDSLGRHHKFHPNCRCTPVGITSTPKKEKRMKVRNKFYVAAPSVTTESEQAQDNTRENVYLATSPNDRSGKWTRKDLASAIAHAQTLLEADPTKDHVAVVKIVKIVRRPKPKFIVEDVK